MASGSSLEGYSYHCVDYSLLTRWISQRIAPWLDARVPACVSADQITQGAALCALGMTLSISLAPQEWSSITVPLSAFLLVMYCLLDHVDGYRARRTGRSSAWGEFLDHGVDAAVVSMVVLTVLLCEPAADVSAVIAIFFHISLTLATVLVWGEQYLTGRVRLPVFGPVEGILIAVLFMLGSAVPSIRQSLVIVVVPGLGLIELLLCMVSVWVMGMIVYRLVVLPSAAKLLFPFLLMCVMVLACVALHPETLFISAALLALCTLSHASILIYSHLMCRSVSLHHQVILIIFPGILFGAMWLNPQTAPWLWMTPFGIAIAALNVWCKAFQDLRSDASISNAW